MPSIQSKLPKVGTTIFTVMSKMAQDFDAINLSQGYPDFNGPEALLKGVGEHILKGHNQYPPMAGIPQLRQAISDKVQRHYHADVDAETEITVTSGATEAIFAAIHTVVSAGDEVIIFDPAFDCYDPAIALAGGKSIHLHLNSEDFSIPWDKLHQALNPKTKLIILNTPHNPSGSVFNESTISQLQHVIAQTDAYLLSDDVYEHILFDQREHTSFLRYPDLRARSFIVSSFGKTYHATGWKIGYCIAPPALTAEFRKVHQFLVFTTTTPMQHALADYMAADPQWGFELAGFYQAKRDFFCNAMSGSRFTFTPSAGTYFQVMDYSAISTDHDVDFCEWLTQEIGVAAIPFSVFYESPPEQTLIRFCFAKDETTLATAAERLCQI